MSATATPKLTYDDYCLLPDDGRRHEIIAGEHYVSPAPPIRHQRILQNLFFELERFLRANPLGIILLAPTDVMATDFDVVQPDLLFVSNDHIDRITERGIRGAPDLAVEVLSASTRRTDELIKRTLYENIGVTEYWIVDPDLDAVKVYRRQGPGFVRAAELSLEASDRLDSPLLAGFSVDLAALFPPHR
jgi:Uma2 family endonuclease